MKQFRPHLRASLYLLAILASSATAKPPVTRQGESTAPTLTQAFSTPEVASYLSPTAAAEFAKQIEHDLAAKGARLALVFRTGRPRDKLPQGIVYTHGAFFVYSDIVTEDNRTLKGYAVHNLYHGDGINLAVDQSYLHQDFPFDFIAPSAVNDVAIIIPSPEMQRRMIELINSDTYQKLHITNYSLVSNPLDTRYQNCTEFMLDIVASAAWQTSHYPQIKANLKAHFKPTKVKAPVLQLVFGPLFDKTLTTDDHQESIKTATYESLATFMKDNGLLSSTYSLNYAPKSAPLLPVAQGQ